MSLSINFLEPAEMTEMTPLISGGISRGLRQVSSTTKKILSYIRRLPPDCHRFISAFIHHRELPLFQLSASYPLLDMEGLDQREREIASTNRDTFWVKVAEEIIPLSSEERLDKSFRKETHDEIAASLFDDLRSTIIPEEGKEEYQNKAVEAARWKKLAEDIKECLGCMDILDPEKLSPFHDQLAALFMKKDNYKEITAFVLAALQPFMAPERKRRTESEESVRVENSAAAQANKEWTDQIHTLKNLLSNGIYSFRSDIKPAVKQEIGEAVVAAASALLTLLEIKEEDLPPQIHSLPPKIEELVHQLCRTFPAIAIQLADFKKAPLMGNDRCVKLYCEAAAAYLHKYPSLNRSEKIFQQLNELTRERFFNNSPLREVRHATHRLIKEASHAFIDPPLLSGRQAKIALERYKTGEIFAKLNIFEEHHALIIPSIMTCVAILVIGSLFCINKINNMNFMQNGLTYPPLFLNAVGEALVSLNNPPPPYCLAPLNHVYFLSNARNGRCNPNAPECSLGICQQLVQEVVSYAQQFGQQMFTARNPLPDNCNCPAAFTPIPSWVPPTMALSLATLLVLGALWNYKTRIYRRMRKAYEEE